MSSHHLDEHHPDRDTSQATERKPGRRRASRAARASYGVGVPSMIGGAALLVAALGAVTLGQAISSNGDSAAASEIHGGYVADLSAASLEGRDATLVSRSGTRPAGVAKAATLTKAAKAAAVLDKKAEKAAALRDEMLRSAANNAEVYAEELASDVWVLPTTDFNISTWFGEAGPYWSSGYHTGIDLATAFGTPAVSVSSAVVMQTGYDGAYGNQIRLQLENGDEVWYNHLSSIEVTVGESIVKGQEIGRVGDTGNAFGYHLHFEYRLASDLTKGVDPKPFFAEHGITL